MKRVHRIKFEKSLEKQVRSCLYLLHRGLNIEPQS